VTRIVGVLASGMTKEKSENRLLFVGFIVL
ncbi:hypothetical protein HKBW3S43_02051, partial [Candidatus Hakubella thermalkaliphila]